MKFNSKKLFISKDMAFFDNPENGTGALCSRLATEVSSVQGVSYRTIPRINKIMFPEMGKKRWKTYDRMRGKRELEERKESNINVRRLWIKTGAKRFRMIPFEIWKEGMFGRARQQVRLNEVWR